jgi:hypothetical protein
MMFLRIVLPVAVAWIRMPFVFPPMVLFSIRLPLLPEIRPIPKSSLLFATEPLPATALRRMMLLWLFTTQFPPQGGREVHIIADNLSAHKTKLVRAFLAAHPAVHLHFTPTCASWLNQVELWFSKIESDVISRGIFSSTRDLSRGRFAATSIGKPRCQAVPVDLCRPHATHRITS